MTPENGYDRQDRYGRTISDVLLTDGTNVNHTLVKNGWCWWYRKYAPSDTELERLEKEARDAKKGLWVDPAPIPPGSTGKQGEGSRSTSQILYRWTLKAAFPPVVPKPLGPFLYAESPLYPPPFQAGASTQTESCFWGGMPFNLASVAQWV